jgi:hypothetical protein
MTTPNGRLRAGQPLNGAISASRWNDMCDAADIVHGRTGGTKGATNFDRAHLLAKTSAAWDKGTSQTLNVYAGAQGSEQQLGDQIKAFNKFADIEADAWVMLARVGSGWYVISAECGA